MPECIWLYVYFFKPPFFTLYLMNVFVSFWLLQQITWYKLLMKKGGILCLTVWKVHSPRLGKPHYSSSLVMLENGKGGMCAKEWSQAEPSGKWLYQSQAFIINCLPRTTFQRHDLKDLKSSHKMRLQHTTVLLPPSQHHQPKTCGLKLEVFMWVQELHLIQVTAKGIFPCQQIYFYFMIPQHGTV